MEHGRDQFLDNLGRHHSTHTTAITGGVQFYKVSANGSYWQVVDKSQNIPGTKTSWFMVGDSGCISRVKDIHVHRKAQGVSETFGQLASPGFKLDHFHTEFLGLEPLGSIHCPYAYLHQSADATRR